MQDLAELDRYLIQRSPVGAWVLEPDGTTVWFNPIMCNFLGRSPDDLLSMRAHSAFDEQGQGQFESFLERMRSGVESEPAVECLLHRPDGTTTWVLITASTMTIQGRAMVVLRVVDYDHRRLLHDELTQAQTLGRMGSWRFDHRTGESSWSDELFRVVGRDPAEGPLTPDQFAGLVLDADHGLVDTFSVVGPFATELPHQTPRRGDRLVEVAGRGHGRARPPGRLAARHRAGDD